jgi:NAD+ diphosphatase
MSDRKTVYSGDYIRRFGEIRTDADALRSAFANPDSRFLPVRDGQCLVAQNRPALLEKKSILPDSDNPHHAIFLGRLENRFLFAVDTETGESPGLIPGSEFLGLRDLTTTLAEPEAALLAYAKAMVAWQRSHRYCGVCGSPNRALEGGFVMECSNADCGRRSFPRLDPAVIVLVHRGDRCLLGRQTKWPEGRFSTIAGFVEPGENLEDAIRREVREETDIRVGKCEYLASQPWPFPSALMIGYQAEAESEAIRLNDGELAEARWLTRGELATGAVVLPPRFSVAYRLIESWFDLVDGPRLAGD